MAKTAILETPLAGVFSKGPKLSPNSRAAIVEWVPWLDLLIGVFALLAVYWLWHWAHAVNVLTSYVNSVNYLYGGNTVSTDYMTTAVWIALGALAIEALLFLAAFTPLKIHRKSGWNLAFYASIVNVIYGVLLLFTDYGGFGNFIGYLIGSLVCFWVLFQIRPAYS